MNETSLTLLEKLCLSPGTEVWERLVQLYGPLLRSWLHKYELQDSDVKDVLQEVLLAVSQDISNFEHNGRTGAFRTWLKNILINRIRNFWRARDRRPLLPGNSDLHKRLDQLDDPQSELSQLWNREYDQYVLRELLELAQPQFAPKTWEAFIGSAIQGRPAEDVAQELGLSLNAVFIAKSRVLAKLRQEAAGLVESSYDFFGSS